MSETIKPLISSHLSPHSIVSELQAALPEIQELYVVYKRHDGEYVDVLFGDLAGLSFCVQLMQHYIGRQLTRQDQER